MENNKGGFPVKNASYWRKQYLELSKKTDYLCDIVLNEYPKEHENYLYALKVQNNLEVYSPQEEGNEP